IIGGTVDLGAFEDQIVQTAPTSPQTGIEASTTDTFALDSFTDAAPGVSSWNVDVNWGDGSSDTTFSVSSMGALPNTPHTFAEEGPYTVTVTVSDGLSDVGQQTFTANIADVAVTINPEASPLPPTGAKVSTGTVEVARFTDPGNPTGTLDGSGTEY